MYNLKEPISHECSLQVVLVNLKDLSCFTVSVATLIGDSKLERAPTADSEGEDDDDEGDIPDVNILPDDDMDE